jgi:hypothetical protein
MTDASARTPFIIVAMLVGLTTYFIVFNLDALVSLGWTTYSGFRRERILQMTKNETSESWKARGQGYNRFEPDRGNSKLSKWYILLYWLLNPFQRSIEPEEDEDKDGGDTYTPRNSTETHSSSAIEHAQRDAQRDDGVLAAIISSLPRPSNNGSTEAKPSRAAAAKNRLRRLFKIPEASTGEMSETGNSKVKAWQEWLRRLFKISESSTRKTAGAENSRRKAWKEWMRILSKNPGKVREKNGPGTV